MSERHRPSGFAMELRDAKLAMEIAVSKAPDDSFRYEAKGILSRVEDLLEMATKEDQHA